MVNPVGRPPLYDWPTIQLEFVHDNVPLHNGVTLKTIAEKYNIPYQTVRRRAAAEKWHSDRYFCYRMKTGRDKEFYRKIDEKIQEIESRNKSKD